MRREREEARVHILPTVCRRIVPTWILFSASLAAFSTVVVVGIIIKLNPKPYLNGYAVGSDAATLYVAPYRISRSLGYISTPFLRFSGRYVMAAAFMGTYVPTYYFIDELYRAAHFDPG